jgi:hypothetical protein
MRRYVTSLTSLAFGFLVFSSTATATTFTFNTDPFAGSTALTTPGRQVVGNEVFITFNIATDRFALDTGVFGVGNTLLFANDVAANLPTGNVNVIVLQSFDNDNDPATPFAAGTAANLIAAQITSPGPGFFVYFNQGLDLPRLVFSTDLNDNTADLKVLFRMTNLTGQDGRDAIPTFTASNFTVPEPSTFMLTAVGVLVTLGYARRRWQSPVSSEKPTTSSSE